MNMSTKIGIIGSGIVAKILGEGFLKHGFQVMMGTRDVSKLKTWSEAEGQKALMGSFKEAAAFGDIIVLAVSGKVAGEALSMAGFENLAEKVVIDATNPISEEPPVHGVLKFFTSLDESLMEQLQTAFPEAKFVKAFNSVGNAFMVNPPFSEKPTMFICGNDAEAKMEVRKILDQFGWESEDMGMVEAARAIEPLCMLWCIPGFLRNQWNHAFRLVKA